MIELLWDVYKSVVIILSKFGWEQNRIVISFGVISEMILVMWDLGHYMLHKKFVVCGLGCA